MTVSHNIAGEAKVKKDRSCNCGLILLKSNLKLIWKLPDYAH